MVRGCWCMYSPRTERYRSSVKPLRTTRGSRSSWLNATSFLASPDTGMGPSPMSQPRTARGRGQAASACGSLSRWTTVQCGLSYARTSPGVPRQACSTLCSPPQSVGKETGGPDTRGVNRSTKRSHDVCSCSSGRDLSTSVRASPRGMLLAHPSCHATPAPVRLNPVVSGPRFTRRSLDVSTVGLQAVRLGVRLADPERDDLFGMDSNKRAALGGECLRHAADLQTSHAPRLD